MTNNSPKIIDINSTANIWEFAQKHEHLDFNAIFIAFINQILNEVNEEAFNKQRDIWYRMDNLYENLQKLGPCYMNAEKVICLTGEKTEYDIKELLDDIIHGDTKVISYETQMNPSQNHH